MQHNSAQKIRFLVGVAGAALAAIGPVAAHAQAAAEDKTTTPTADAKPQDNQQGLADIVITAERRTQSLQQVPIAATVLDAGDLSRKGVANVADLQSVAPSVAINTYNRSTFINIRGVGIAQSAPTSNPGVAFYIDGQLIPHEQFIAPSFYDIGSIEVLRGPQGTLTGQNSTGGAVYVRTPDPDFDKTSGYIDGTYGSFNALKVVGAVNVAFSDEVALRVAAVRDQRDSFTDNIGPSPSNPGNLKLWAGRMNLAIRSPDDVLRANLRIDYFDSKSDNNAVKRRNDPIANPFVIEEDARSFQNQNGGKISGETKIKVSEGIDFRTIFSYQDFTTIDQTDGDRSATALPRPGPGRVSLVSTAINTFTGEVNLLSRGERDFNWVVGAFYLDETVDVLSRRDNNHTTDFFSSTSTFKTSANNTTKSVFGQVNWFATKPLELIAGLRYSDDRQVYNRIIPAGPPVIGIGPVGVQHSTKLTGKLGINYHLGKNLLYVTASEGYKAGGVNLTIGTANFQPEKNRVYEAGFKTQFLDNQLRVNGDIFYSRYSNIQLSSLAGGLPVTQNAARGKSYGAELEITGQFNLFIPSQKNYNAI